MKKLLLRTSTIVLVFMLMILACQKEPVKDTANVENDDDAASMSVAEAKNWFYTNQQPLLTMKAGKLEGRKSVTMKPDWNQAFKSKNSKYEVVESQILTLGGFGFATAEALSTCKSSNNAGYLNSVSRLVILKNKKDGQIVPFIMTVVGDKDYLEKKKFTMQGETYLKRDKDLSGFVFYHSTEGKFVNGWRYKDGKVIGKIVMNDDNTQGFNLKSAYYFFYSYITICNPTTWTSLDGPDGVSVTYSANCTTTYTVNYTYTTYNGYQTEVSWIQAEEGGGGYGPASAEPITPLPVVLDELKTNPKADCIYQTLSNGLILQKFISRYFGPTEPNHSFLGELNLTWTLGSVTGGYGETIPIGHTDNNQGYSVEIRLDEESINDGSNTRVALTMLHEALHAKLLAEVYDEVGSTDFVALFAYYKGWSNFDNNATGMDEIQETAMLNLYSDEMAIALQSFDKSQGISQPLSFYTEAIKYSLGYNILHRNIYPQGQSAYDMMSASSKKCN